MIAIPAVGRISFIQDRIFVWSPVVKSPLSHEGVLNDNVKHTIRMWAPGFKLGICRHKDVKGAEKQFWCYQLPKQVVILFAEIISRVSI